MTSTADILRLVAIQLEAGERSFKFMADVLGMPFEPTVKAQETVLLIAAWLDGHPDVDDQMGQLLAAAEGATP